MPLIFISLAGMVDSHVLKGHDFTYIGSQPGIIVREVISKKTNQCVFLFDEVDKCSDKV